MVNPATPAPRDDDLAPFLADPLTYLRHVRAQRGSVFELHTGRALFSRLSDCPMVAVCFGAEAVRQVLTDPESFALPASASDFLALPPSLAKLNRSLHSMKEPEHGQHKRKLGALLRTTRWKFAEVSRALEVVTAGWCDGRSHDLLSRMRELSVALARCVLLGPDSDVGLPALLHDYFLLRRETAAPGAKTDPVMREALLTSGHQLDRRLRDHLRESNHVLGRLCLPELRGGLSMSEDEAVGHANILFVSATEPVAVALTWTLLLLSQQPDQRCLARRDPMVLERLLLESLRLLPPNGFMVRVTTREARIGSLTLPPRSELVLCPLLAHREAHVFEQPEVFLPQRWMTARPSPYQYFPFGAGNHSCVGRSMGIELLRAALGFMLHRFDTLLDTDQSIDWRLHVLFMPRSDITVRFEPTVSAATGGRWTGPVTELVDLESRPVQA